jgi:hypothetical protein
LPAIVTPEPWIERDDDLTDRGLHLDLQGARLLGGGPLTRASTAGRGSGGTVSACERLHTGQLTARVAASTILVVTSGWDSMGT